MPLWLDHLLPRRAVPNQTPVEKSGFIDNHDILTPVSVYKCKFAGTELEDAQRR